MKKIISVLLIITIVLSLAACGNAPASSGSAPTTSDAQSSQNTSSTELTPLELGKKCFEAKDWIGAIDALKSVISIEEDYAEAQELLKKANDEYAKMVIAEVENRAKTDTPLNVINYIIQSQKIAYLPELIEELDRQYKLYTDELTAEASKLYDEGKTADAIKVFDDAFKNTNFSQIPEAKENFLKSKAVYLMKDLQPYKQSPLIGTSTEVNDARGNAPEVIAFGLQEAGKVSLRFELNEEYSRLRGFVIIPQYCDDTYSPASVKITVDGADLFSRTKMKQGFVAAEFDLSVANRRRVTFEIVGGSNNEKTNYPWICDAYLLK